MKLIHPFDIPIIKAFLLREAQDYTWRDGIEGPGSIKFQEDCLQYLQEELDTEKHPEFKESNFVRIQSMTNMGLLCRELTLDPNGSFGNPDIVCILPPSPRGGINIQYGNLRF